MDDAPPPPDDLPVADPLGTTDRILREESFLRRLARRIVRRDADADDLVQETLLRAYAARDRFRTGSSMRAWLATILRRLFLTASITEQRRRTRPATDVGGGAPGASSTDEVGPLDRIAGPEYDPSRMAEADFRDHMSDRLHRAYTGLPDTYRQPFILFALDGLSYAEIASRLRIPVGTVMSRIHRARTRLRERALSTTTSEV